MMKGVGVINLLSSETECDGCRKEITKDEYESNDGLCNDCWISDAW